MEKKHKVVKVKLHRAEGPSDLPTDAVVADMAQANYIVKQWASTVTVIPEIEFNADKVDFTVHWDNGDEYTGTYLMENEHTVKQVPLTDHIVYLQKYSLGGLKPDHISQPQYDEFVHRTTTVEERAFLEVFLRDYELE